MALGFFIILLWFVLVVFTGQRLIELVRLARFSLGILAVVLDAKRLCSYWPVNGALNFLRSSNFRVDAIILFSAF